MELGAVVRRIRGDWQAKYGHGLDVLESFVERGRHGHSAALRRWVCPATRSPQDPSACAKVTGPSCWFRFRTDRTRTVEFSVSGSAAKATFGLYRVLDGGAGGRSLELLTCAEGGTGEQPVALERKRLAPGTDYLVMLAGAEAGFGRALLTWTGSPELVLPEFGAGIKDGHLAIELLVTPGQYELRMGSDLTQWPGLVRTNLPGVLFQWVDPEPATQAVRFYELRRVSGP